MPKTHPESNTKAKVRAVGSEARLNKGSSIVINGSNEPKVHIEFSWQNQEEENEEEEAKNPGKSSISEISSGSSFEINTSRNQLPGE